MAPWVMKEKPLRNYPARVYSHVLAAGDYCSDPSYRVSSHDLKLIAVI